MNTDCAENSDGEMRKIYEAAYVKGQSARRIESENTAAEFGVLLHEIHLN